MFLPEVNRTEFDQRQKKYQSKNVQEYFCVGKHRPRPNNNEKNGKRNHFSWDLELHAICS